MIPKIIHQIWIGDKKPPTGWMQTWKDKNPDFTYKLWTENELQKLFDNTVNYLIYRKFYRLRLYHGAADIARVEILKAEGGVYVDADSIALEPLGRAPFLSPQISFFAVYDFETVGYPGRITNGAMGAEPHHPILVDYATRIHLERFSVQPWRTVGGKLLTECVKRHGPDQAVMILPAWTFWPENFDGRKIKPEGKVYARQMWGTSLKSY